MDEYQFQHETDPLLKTQAAEALKKTEWLEYLEYIKAIMVIKGIWAVKFLFDIVIMLFDIYRPAEKLKPGQLSNYTMNDLFPMLLLAVFAVTFFRIIFKWRHKYRMVINRRYQVKKPKYRYVMTILLTVIPLFFFGFGNVRQRVNLCSFACIASLLIWDLIDFRKVKQDLRSRGIIGPKGLTSPPAVPVFAAGPTIDELSDRQSLKQKSPAKTPTT